jgi:hypothetical protein
VLTWWISLLVNWGSEFACCSVSQVSGDATKHADTALPDLGTWSAAAGFDDAAFLFVVILVIPGTPVLVDIPHQQHHSDILDGPMPAQ